MNTYAWIIPTPNSKDDKINWTNEIIIIKILFCDLIVLPINVNKRCPETIFAINRIPRVKGRIEVLISSIITINLINGIGVPEGTRCENIFFVYAFHPYKKNPTHKGKEINKFKVICLVEVNEFGINPIKLENIIKVKIEINIIFLLSFCLLIAIFNCSDISLNNNVFKILFRDGNGNCVIYRNKNTNIIIIQFISIKGKFILDLGSKDKNNLIFKNFSVFFFLDFLIFLLNSK